MIRNRYLLPLIPQLINRVRMKKLFTKFDVRWGYNNVRIKEGDEWKAAFITNEGLYEPTVMFFGLTNSPTTFQAMMNAIFEDEIREGWLTVYMDDMLIATPGCNAPTGVKGQTLAKRVRLLGKSTGSYGKPVMIRCR